MKSVVRWMLRATFSPPRCTYKANDTISVITTNSVIYSRTIFEFISPKGEKIMSSLWRDSTVENPSKCLIYLHSLGANQFEVINIIPTICTKDLCLVAFDFPGCGLSGGTILPLDGSGANLVKSCVDYLKSTFHFTEFAVWGRSMGAAVALHTVSVYTDIFKCIVADSSFACTEKILKDQGKANGFPSFLVKMLMPIIKKEAKEDLKTKVDVPFPIEFVPNAQIPLLQGHGNKDRFVPCDHAKLIFDNYGAIDKQLNFFEGKHNSPRPNSWYETVSRFLYRHLNIQERPRCYDYVYRVSKLHIGPVEQVLPDIIRVNEVLHQRALQKNLRRNSSKHSIPQENDQKQKEENKNDGNDENMANNEYSNQYESDESSANGDDNDYDYDYEYEQEENKNHEPNNEETIEDNQSKQNIENENNNITVPQSILVPEESNQTQSPLIDSTTDAELDHPTIPQPIENENSSCESIKEPQQAPPENNVTIESEVKPKKRVRKNKKRDDNKRKTHKVLFDSLSEIGTDIDLGDKINMLNQAEEMERRKEMLNSINHHHHRHHHRHHHHHHRIPLESTRKSSNNADDAKESSQIDLDENPEKNNQEKITKNGSILNQELPLDNIPDKEN